MNITEQQWLHLEQLEGITRCDKKYVCLERPREELCAACDLGMEQVPPRLSLRHGAFLPLPDPGLPRKQHGREPPRMSAGRN